MAQIISAGVSEPEQIAGRPGTSPIGTYSPNTGSVGNTNSTYAPSAFTSGIVETVATTYTLQNTDYQGIIVFNTSSPITVTLNSAVNENFSSTILNLGTGAITLTPTLGYTVNGVASLALGSGQGVQVFFAQRTWWAYAGATVVTPAFDYIYPYVETSANYLITSANYQVNVTANSVTVTLPTAVGIQGRIFSVKNTGTGTVTLATTSSQTIDGVLTQTLLQWDDIEVMSTAVNWIIR